MPAEVHQDRRLGVSDLPRVAESKPRVGLFDLLAVDERLPEDAVLITDSVAGAGDVHGRQRVDETGRQPAKTSVAQARLHLLRAQLGQAQPAGLERPFGDVIEIGGQQVVAQLSAEQVFRGEVRNGLGLNS